MLIGQTLKGRYRIYDRLGVGGAATVYLGRNSETGQMVVVKVVHSHLLDDQFIGRFEREIDLLQQVRSPYVVALYDWALDEHDPNIGQTLSYVVTEFVEGHTLADIIDTRGALNEPDALAIARQVALGLSAIHRMGIVHRDVKSQNIMITPADQAKLIDFGIAKGQDHVRLTQSSHFAGTLYYAPPEQILEMHSVDHRADLYALGVVLYEMLMASLPIKAREVGTVASRIIAGKLDPITGVSPPVEALVNHMMAHDVRRRISSADEVIARIDAIIGGPQQPQLPERPSPTATISLRALEDQLNPKPTPTPAFMLVTQEGITFPLMLAETIIGRSHPRHAVAPDIDLAGSGQDNALTVSRRHCRIFRESDAYYIEDLGSMNGTRLNNRTLQSGVPRRLVEGDRIMVGRVLLLFQSTDS